MKSPKSRFQESVPVKEWADTVDKKLFSVACDFALLQMMSNQESASAQSAADAHQQLQGAKKFVQILSDLATPDRNPEPPLTAGKLNYGA